MSTPYAQPAVAGSNEGNPVKFALISWRPPIARPDDPEIAPLDESRQRRYLPPHWHLD
jgi:hypothetical protein